MSANQQVSEQEPIVEEQAEAGDDENQLFDTLEDAAAALGDEGEPEEEPEDVAEADEIEESEADDSVEVTLDDGEKVTLKELKSGYFRAKDYTHKTTEVAQERKEVAATKAELAERTTVIETAMQNLSGYLQSLIPPEPSLQLARTNPGEYQYQIALRQNAIAELGQLISIKGAVDEHKQTVSEAETREYRNREQAALVKAMPELADPVKKAAFDQRVMTTAKQLGFSEEEIASTADHRVLRLVELARIGQKAIENRNNANRRVETPKLAKAKPAAAPVNVENRKAMHQLAKSGSRADALKVDF